MLYFYFLFIYIFFKFYRNSFIAIFQEISKLEKWTFQRTHKDITAYKCGYFLIILLFQLLFQSDFPSNFQDGKIDFSSTHKEITAYKSRNFLKIKKKILNDFFKKSFLEIFPRNFHSRKIVFSKGITALDVVIF